MKTVGCREEDVAANLGRKEKIKETRSSWLKCALRDDEAVYWVSIGQWLLLGVTESV